MEEQKEKQENPLSKEEMERIEQAFIGRMVNLGVKNNSKDYIKRQQEFFAGVMTVINFAVPSWTIAIWRGDVIGMQHESKDKF